MKADEMKADLPAHRSPGEGGKVGLYGYGRGRAGDFVEAGL